MDEIYSIVLHSEGFDGVDGWCIRNSGTFEIFKDGKCRVRISGNSIDPSFLIIDKRKVKLGQGVSVVTNISAPSVCSEPLRQFVVKELVRARDGRSGDELVSDAKKLVEFIEGDKKCQG